MKNKIKLRTIFSSSVLVATSLFCATSFAANITEDKREFIFDDRRFNSIDDAVKYLFQKQKAYSTTQSVYGDIYKSYSNSEKGILNKRMLPDYDPSRTSFVYKNAGGGLTDDFDAAKRTYFNRGRVKRMYEDGFSKDSFSTEVAAINSMNSKKMNTFFGLYNARMIENGTYINKYVNPFNIKDLDYFKRNISKKENFQKIIKDNLAAGEATKVGEYKLRVLNTNKEPTQIGTPLNNKEIFSFLDIAIQKFKNSNNWSNSYSGISIQQENDKNNSKLTLSFKKTDINVKTKLYSDKFYLGWNHGWHYSNNSMGTEKSWWDGSGIKFKIYHKDSTEKTANAAIIKPETILKPNYGTDGILNLLNGKNTGSLLKNANEVTKESLGAQKMESDLINYLRSLKKYIDDNFKTIYEKVKKPDKSIFSFMKSKLIFDRVKTKVKETITSKLKSFENNKIQKHTIKEIPKFKSKMEYYKREYHSWSVPAHRDYWWNAWILKEEQNWKIDSTITSFASDSQNNINLGLGWFSDLINDITNSNQSHSKNKNIKLSFGTSDIFVAKVRLDKDGELELVPDSLDYYNNYKSKNSNSTPEEEFYKNFHDAIQAIKGKSNKEKIRLLKQIWEERFIPHKNKNKNAIPFKDEFKLGFNDGRISETQNFENNIKIFLTMLYQIFNKYKDLDALLAEVSDSLPSWKEMHALDIFKDRDRLFILSKYKIYNAGNINPSIASEDFGGMFATTGAEWINSQKNEVKPVPTEILIAYDSNGNVVNVGKYKHDSELLMEFNSLLVQEPARDFEHVFYRVAPGHKELISSTITTIYKLKIGDREPIFFEKYSYLKEYVRQYVKNNLFYV